MWVLTQCPADTWNHKDKDDCCEFLHLEETEEPRFLLFSWLLPRLCPKWIQDCSGFIWTFTNICLIINQGLLCTNNSYIYPHMATFEHHSRQCQQFVSLFICLMDFRLYVRNCQTSSWLFRLLPFIILLIDITYQH